MFKFADVDSREKNGGVHGNFPRSGPVATVTAVGPNPGLSDSPP